MKVPDSFVTLVRILARPFPRVYAFLKKLHHQFIFLRERSSLRRNYPATLSVRYDEKFLENIKNKGYYSQYGQDYFLLKHGLIPKKSGTFIDVGCNDPINTSNSCYLEKVCGYTGIAIEPLDEFTTAWEIERHNTIFINCFVSNKDEELDFVKVSGKQGWENKLSGAADNVRLSGKNIDAAIIKVKPRRLQDILDESGIAFDVDVLLVDVEGHEIDVLASSDWSQKKPAVIVVENNGSQKAQEDLRSYLIGNGYRLHTRMDIADDVFVRN